MGNWSKNQRLWVKSIVISAALAAFITLLALLQYLPPLAQDLIEVIGSTFFNVVSLFRGSDALQNSVSAYDDALASGVTIFSLSVPMMRLVVVPCFWPDVPAFLDTEIVRKESYLDDPLRENSPLIGREAEMNALMRFAGNQIANTNAWMLLSGPHAIGKSKLANAWLRKLKDLGWEVGYLSNSTLPELETGRLRKKKTAIVIDEFARRVSGTQELYELMIKLSKKIPVCAFLSSIN